MLLTAAVKEALTLKKRRTVLIELEGVDANPSFLITHNIYAWLLRTLNEKQIAITKLVNYDESFACERVNVLDQLEQHIEHSGLLETFTKIRDCPVSILAIAYSLSDSELDLVSSAFQQLFRLVIDSESRCVLVRHCGHRTRPSLIRFEGGCLRTEKIVPLETTEPTTTTQSNLPFAKNEEPPMFVESEEDEF